MTDERSAPSERPADWLGKLIGIGVFMGGIALIALTFKLAYDMFQVPPEQALRIAQGKTLDLAVAGQSFGSVLIRILLLVVMGLMGSLVANRGISLYERSGGRRFYAPSPPKAKRGDAE